MDNNQEFQDNGSALISSLLKMASTTMDNSPLAMLSRAAGSWAGQPTGQNPVPGMAQAAVQIGPYQKGVSKALSEAGQTHTIEALQAGMNPTDIQNHSIMQPDSKMFDQQTVQPAVASMNAAQTPQAPQTQQPGVDPLHVLGSLLKLGLQGAGDTLMAPVDLQKSQTAKNIQETSNMKPLGPGEEAGARLTPDQASYRQLQQQQNTASIYGNQVSAALGQLERLHQSTTEQTENLKALKEVPWTSVNPIDQAKNINAAIKNMRSLDTEKQKVYASLENLSKNPPKLSQSNGSKKTFSSEKEAIKSGYKGMAIINGRPARIS